MPRQRPGRKVSCPVAQRIVRPRRCVTKSRRRRFPTRSSLVLAALVIALAPASILPAHAQGTQQTVQLARLDVVKASTGYRASKVMGASVVNDANETVGKVDDVILGDDRTSHVVISVGGFLGVGNKLVALPTRRSARRMKS